MALQKHHKQLQYNHKILNANLLHVGEAEVTTVRLGSIHWLTLNHLPKHHDLDLPPSQDAILANEGV